MIKELETMSRLTLFDEKQVNFPESSEIFERRNIANIPNY